MVFAALESGLENVSAFSFPLNVVQSVLIKYPLTAVVAAAILITGAAPPDDITGAVAVTPVTVPEPLLLKVFQSAELK